MSVLLSKLFRSPSRPARHVRPRLGVEHLDRRDLPAVTFGGASLFNPNVLLSPSPAPAVTFNPIAAVPAVLPTAELNHYGVLTITGTEGNDRVAIVESDFGPTLNITGVSRVTIDGVVQASNSVPSGTVRSLSVTLKGGNDTFTLTRRATLQNFTVMPRANAAYNTLQNILVNGGEGNDTIDLSAANPAPTSISGGGGDDSLTGGPGNDLIIGGAGRDILYGNGGNDNLYAGEQGGVLPPGEVYNYLDGGPGNDRLVASRGTNHLVGGIGNDSLIGGSGAAPDFTYMTGGAGADRYLVQDFRQGFDSRVPRDVIVGREAADAVVHFADSFNSAFVFRGWSDSEILQADTGFQLLVDRTGNTRLLKQSNGGDVTFRRVDFIAPAVGGDNNLAGVIRITDIGMGSLLSLNIIHELGHNWNSQANLSAIPGGPSWSGWLNVSGWQMASGATPAGRTRSLDGAWTYLNSAQFVRDYGRTNPSEDWSTSWEAYFFNTNRIPAKQAYLDGFFTAVSRV